MKRSISGHSEAQRATCTLFWESVWGGWVSGQQQAELVVKGQWLHSTDEDVTREEREGHGVWTSGVVLFLCSAGVH